RGGGRLQVERVGKQLLQRMGQRRGIPGLELGIPGKSEIEAEVRLHCCCPSSAMNSRNRSWTLLTCTGSWSRLPSSTSGISLSKAGPECDPINATRTG